MSPQADALSIRIMGFFARCDDVHILHCLYNSSFSARGSYLLFLPCKTGNMPCLKYNSDWYAGAVRTVPEMKGGELGSHLAPVTKRATPPGWALRRAASRRTCNPGLLPESGLGAFRAIILSVKAHWPTVSCTCQPGKFRETADLRG